MTKTMKCLTIKQPWAGVIFCQMNPKDVENQNWITRYRGPLLIHAAKVFDKSRKTYVLGSDVLGGLQLPSIHHKIQSAIIGVVDLVGIKSNLDCFSLWVFGPWCWQLSKPRLFYELIPYRGRQWLYSVPLDVVAAELEKVGVKP